MKLGHTTEYPNTYQPDLIDPIERDPSRKKINYDDKRFQGEDIWTIFEFSHIQENNTPHNAILTVAVPSASKYITESKSLKLYFNSINQLKKNFNDTLNTIEQDITDALNCQIDISKQERITNTFNSTINSHFVNLDQEKISSEYNEDWSFFPSDSKRIQRFHTSLFRSNCPVTNQPDWASIFISMECPYDIPKEELLTYLISFREHQGFHEQCVEEIISKLDQTFSCTSIGVYARFTRRGGIDINPYRYAGTEDPVMKDMVEKSKKLEFWDPRQ
jgi:7-cyano-7-deazaguanine reductase